MDNSEMIRQALRPEADNSSTHALKVADELLSEFYRTIDKDHFYRGRLIETIRIVREAIAKAEGK